MRKTILALAVAVPLAGCASTSSQQAQYIADKITTYTADFKEKAKAVQARAIQICEYVPTAASVIAIFNSGIGADVGVVANAICAAVTTVPLADGPGDKRPKVGGVVVRGHFVK